MKLTHATVNGLLAGVVLASLVFEVLPPLVAVVIQSIGSYWLGMDCCYRMVKKSEGTKFNPNCRIPPGTRGSPT